MPQNPLFLTHLDVFLLYGPTIPRSRLAAWDRYVLRARDFRAVPRFRLPRGALLRTEGLFSQYHQSLRNADLIERSLTSFHMTDSGASYSRFTRRVIDEGILSEVRELDDSFLDLDELERLLRG